MSGGSSRRYPPELRERAVRMVAEIRGQHDSEWAAISEVARLLGVGLPTTLNARDQPPAEVSDQRVSGLTGAVQNGTAGTV
ncbi:transposase [Mycobacterium tuberculosis KT-0008]|nr:transposase [Mycobacterium tuberculosis KT-0008]